MLDKDDQILYIWMSVNLKSRVNSYFSDKADLNFAKKKMISQVHQVNYIETHTDVEALVLETNLIKQHKPKYNILMKDDKNLSYIKISNDPIPLVIRTRNKSRNGKYFWPYSQYVNLGTTLHELKKLFVLGNHNKLPKKGSAPCMDYYIGICPWHCTWDRNMIDTYVKNVSNFERFMKWDTKKIFQQLEEQMHQHAVKLEFEKAQECKKNIEQLKLMQQKQLVRDQVSWDLDVVMTLEKYGKIFIGRLEIRNGSIVWTYRTTIKNTINDTIDTILQHYLLETYIDSDFSGWLVLESADVSDSLRSYLKSKKISIEIPLAGKKLSFIEFCKNDLLNFALSTHLAWLSTKQATRKDTISLMQKLYPNKQIESKTKVVIECYDISHHQWEHTVASKSVIINGKRDTSKYKRYRMKTLSNGKIDDFESMREVLGRRTRAHCEGVDPFPSLIVIDGGKGQLSSSIHAIESIFGAFNDSDTDISDIVAICSLAKREEEVFVPGLKNPIILKKWTPELMLLQRARDEAHRFAINFNRTSREKAYTKTILDEIPWIGDKTKKKLLVAFGSITGIENASRKEVKDLVTKTQYEKLVQYGIVIDS